MKIYDLTLQIDGLRLKKGQSLEDWIEQLNMITDSLYPISYDVTWEEEHD